MQMFLASPAELTSLVKPVGKKPPEQHKVRSCSKQWEALEGASPSPIRLYVRAVILRQVSLATTISLKRELG